MSYREKPIEKKYWSITEVAEMFDISTSELRFWEKSFGRLNSRFGKAKHSPSGTGKQRVYTACDIQKVRTVYNLLNIEGFTIPGAKKRLIEIRQKIF